MRKIALAAFISVALLSGCVATGQSSSGAGSPSDNLKSVNIPTFTPADYDVVLGGNYKQNPASISGSLYMPEQAKSAVPAVVIMHGSGGIRQDTEVLLARTLQANGIAALVVDSFTGRGLSGIGGDQGKFPIVATVLDSFQALQALRNTQGIDGSRVGVVGFSRGAVGAMFSSQAPLSQAVLGSETSFAAHVPVYPGCNIMWDDVRPAKAPLLFLLAENDNLAPPEKCRQYVDKINAGGGSAQAVVYPGVYHQFMVASVSNVPGVQNLADCDIKINKEGVTYYKNFDVKSSGWDGFVKKVSSNCGKAGATIGGTSESQARALKDIAAFFKEKLKY